MSDGRHARGDPLRRALTTDRIGVWRRDTAGPSVRPDASELAEWPPARHRLHPRLRKSVEASMRRNGACTECLANRTTRPYSYLQRSAVWRQTEPLPEVSYLAIASPFVCGPPREQVVRHDGPHAPHGLERGCFVDIRRVPLPPLARPCVGDDWGRHVSRRSTQWTVVLETRTGVQSCTAPRSRRPTQGVWASSCR